MIFNSCNDCSGAELVGDNQKKKNSEERLEICNQCEKLICGTICGECKCIVKIKTMFGGQKCPLGKW